MTGQLFLSGLLPSGTAYREITLDHPLERGAHRVNVVYTQVEGDLDDLTLVDQVVVTMDFTVAG